MNNTDTSPVLPAASPDPADQPDQPKSTFNLAPDQLADSGLADCKPGDAYTALVTFRMSEDGTPGSFDVDSVADVMPAAAEGATPALGDSPDEGTAGAEDQLAPSDEESMLGYKRPNTQKPFPKIQGLRG